MDADVIGRLRAVALEPTYWDLCRHEIDPGRVVARLAENGVNGIRLGAQSHTGWAYFPSQVVAHAPGLAGRDLVAEFQAACARHGLYLIVYTNASAVRDGVYSEQETWAARGEEGAARLIHGTLREMCRHSPYFDKYLALLEEIGQRYDPDVMYIDCFPLSFLCQCQWTRQRYAEACDEALSLEVDWRRASWRRHFQWIKQDLEEHGRRIVAACRSRRPDMPVVFNRAGPWGVFTLPEDQRTYGTEIGNGVHAESAVRMYSQSFHHIDEQAAIGETLPAPVWCWVEHGMMPWSHLPCQTSELKIKTAKALAYGARPMVWSLPLAPEPDYRGIEAIGQVFKVAGDNAALLEGTKSAAEVAIVFPSTSVLLFDKLGEEAPEAHSLVAAPAVRDEFLGFMHACRRSHIPVRVVLEGDISPELVARCPVLILPNVACLSDEVCAGIRAYCAASGKLLATFATSLRDGDGRLRDDFGLADVLACRLIEPLPRLSTDVGDWQGSYVIQSAETPLFRGVAGKFELPAGGQALRVQPHGEVPGTLRAASEYYCGPPGQTRPVPALVMSSRGVYVPWQLGWTYNGSRSAALRRFIANIIHYLAPAQRLIETDLPASVSVTLRRAPSGALVVYLVNLSCEPQFEVEGVVPVRGAYLSLRSDLLRDPRAQVLGTGQQLPLSERDGRWWVQLPDIEEFCIITVTESG